MNANLMMNQQQQQIQGNPAGVGYPHQIANWAPLMNNKITTAGKGKLKVIKFK